MWYENAPEDQLADIVTDAKAAARLPPQLAALVGATSEVFVQAIHDLLAPQLAFPHRSACVLGDAGAILRPHTAAGAPAGSACSQCVMLTSV